MMPFVVRAEDGEQTERERGIPGKASSASFAAITIRSVQPRAKPETAPMTVPAATARKTVVRLIWTLVTAPLMSRLPTSRPNSSVPIQWAMLGGFRRAAKSIASGS